MRKNNMMWLQNAMCEDCERIFKSEEKLEDHKRFHAIFEMDGSDKIYMYEGILELNLFECEANKGKKKLKFNLRQNI